MLSYMIVGSGPRPLVFVPGAGDGLATPQYTARRLAHWMQSRTAYFRILYVSRRVPLSPDTSLEQQADDIAYLMRELGWPSSMVEAQSAGGPLGVMLGLRHPELVSALVLSSAAIWLDDFSRERCERWLEMLEERDWDAFFAATSTLLWHADKASLFTPFMKLLSHIARPSDPSRLIAILHSLLQVDLRPELPNFSIPTLVTGGKQDRLFRESLQSATAELLPNVTSAFQAGFGHSNDLENPAHVRLLAAFARLKGVGVVDSPRLVGA